MVVGNGSKIMFPRLYAILNQMNCRVEGYGLWDGMNWIWSFQ